MIVNLNIIEDLEKNEFINRDEMAILHNCSEKHIRSHIKYLAEVKNIFFVSAVNLKGKGWYQKLPNNTELAEYYAEKVLMRKRKTAFSYLKNSKVFSQLISDIKEKELYHLTLLEFIEKVGEFQ